jgi:hypothetical protein
LAAAAPLPNTNSSPLLEAIANQNEIHQASGPFEHVQTWEPEPSTLGVDRSPNPNL